jgi:hypothetical protein
VALSQSGKLASGEGAAARCMREGNGAQGMSHERGNCGASCGCVLGRDGTTQFLLLILPYTTANRTYISAYRIYTIWMVTPTFCRVVRFTKFSPQIDKIVRWRAKSELSQRRVKYVHSSWDFEINTHKRGSRTQSRLITRSLN